MIQDTQPSKYAAGQPPQKIAVQRKLHKTDNALARPCKMHSLSNSANDTLHGALEAAKQMHSPTEDTARNPLVLINSAQKTNLAV